MEVLAAQDLGTGYMLANGSWTEVNVSGARVEGGLRGYPFGILKPTRPTTEPMLISFPSIGFPDS